MNFHFSNIFSLSLFTVDLDFFLSTINSLYQQFGLIMNERERKNVGLYIATTISKFHSLTFTL